MEPNSKTINNAMTNGQEAKEPHTLFYNTFTIGMQNFHVELSPPTALLLPQL